MRSPQPPTDEHSAKPGWWARRLDPDRSLSLRLTFAAVAAVLVLVPFSVLSLLVISAWWPLRSLDEGLAESLHAEAVAHPGWASATQVWTDVFGPGPLRVLVLAVVVWLWWRGARRVALWAVTTMVTGGVLGASLKLLFGRGRPELLDPVSHAPGYAFPSGHALTAALAAGVLVLVFLPFVAEIGDARRRRAARWGLWAGALLVTMVTGLSRIALGVHWLSDVLGGWVLGAAVVAATTAAFATWRGRVGHRPTSPLNDGVVEEEGRPLPERAAHHRQA
ncbi:phosphatase PAP2 family protein [Micromonospora sp. NBC_01699]|uniref:phosphatase PAP2 family protein n=1 Tax=Micromonospora sp. NBC_01699 TaxID=2975984 RepID=UPI002E353330|nr:phosphatase PAP2 family protein [Micromonospora sp. NBC_01699]